jgi:hypothetical protein
LNKIEGSESLRNTKNFRGKEITQLFSKADNFRGKEITQLFSKVD